MSNNQPAYLTASGLEKLKKELVELKTKLREIADRIDRAKDLGDLSENAEYHEAKEDYSFTAGRILEIEDSLSRAAVISDKKQMEKVDIGSTIKIKNDAGKEIEYSIVGSNEADPARGRISNESPLAQAFLGRKKGERVDVTSPAGITSYTILEIK